MRKTAVTSARIDDRTMDRIIAAATLKVAKAYGCGADAVAEACSTKQSSRVVDAVSRHCRKKDR